MHIIIYKLPENSRCNFQKCEDDSPTTSHKSILCGFVDFIINFILHFECKMRDSGSAIWWPVQLCEFDMQYLRAENGLLPVAARLKI